LILGSPWRFWARASLNSKHPFFGHPLLAKYGGMLAREARERGLERCKEKGLTRLPILFSFQTVSVVEKLRILETPHRPMLAELAKKAATEVWGIPRERLDAELCNRIDVGKDVLPARNLAGVAFRAGIVGLGEVIRRNGQLIVIARATNWQLLAKELVKGTAELICLHGLNQLDDATYERVLAVTDRIDLEPWMLQTGGELWRRVLRAVPDGMPIAKVLMQLARLPADSLHAVMAKVIEQREGAAELLANATN
jgi:hypothetical protein